MSLLHSIERKKWYTSDENMVPIDRDFYWKLIYFCLNSFWDPMSLEQPGKPYAVISSNNNSFNLLDSWRLAWRRKWQSTSLVLPGKSHGPIKRREVLFCFVSSDKLLHMSRIDPDWNILMGTFQLIWINVARVIKPHSLDNDVPGTNICTLWPWAGSHETNLEL